MHKLLQIIFVFIFVIVILNAPDNDVILDKLHLKDLIAKNNNININKLLNENNCKYIEKEQSLSRSIQENVPRIQIPDASQFSIMVYDNYLKSSEANFLKKHYEATQLCPLSENLLSQEIIDKYSVKFSQNEEIAFMREIVSNTQEKDVLINNLSLEDLITTNVHINNKSLLKDSNCNCISEGRMLLFGEALLKNPSLNINDFIEDKLKRNPDIYETKKNIDETAVEIPNVQMLNNSQYSVIGIDSFLEPNNDFLSQMLSEEYQLFPLLEKQRLPEKVDKQTTDLFQKEDIITKQVLVSNVQIKDLIIDNLHLKDLIAKNEIINKRKNSDCKNGKKEYALSYVEALLKKPSLNLNNLIEDVIKRNPDLRATKRRIEANALVVPRVQILDDPQFTAMRHDSPLRSNSEFFSKMRYELSQVFPFPGKLRLKGKIAEQILKFAQSEEITTKRELVLQTKRLFYQLYLNYAALRINKQNQEIISRFIEDTLALYKTGEEKYDEVLKAQVELQLLKKELLNLLSDHDFIVSMINAILDYPQDNIIGKPQGFFTQNVNYKYQELEQIAMRNRSELRGIKSLVSQQCFKAKLAKRNYFPDFKVSGRYESKLGSKDAAWGAAVSINIPIWIQQKQKREMRESMKNANAFQNDLKDFEAKIRGRIRDLLSKIESTDEKIDLYETGLVPKTSEALLSGEALYKTGKGDFLVLLDTIRQFQDFELEYEAERAQREILLAELERALGVPLEDMTCSTNN